MASHRARPVSSSGSRTHRVNNALERQGQIGTRVPIGNRVDVEVVYLLFPVFQSLETGAKKCTSLRYSERRSPVTRQP